MPSYSAALLKRAKPVRLIAMDVDGVLTNGDVTVLESGEEIKSWNAKDRLVLALARGRKLDLIFAWITGRGSRAVSLSAEDLGIQYVVQRCRDKRKAIEKIMKKHRLSPKQVAFIGDDLIDLPVLTKVGLAVSPADAVSDVKKHVHYISPKEGGKGVVRDVLELVLKAQKKWQPLVNSFLSSS